MARARTAEEAKEAMCRHRAIRALEIVIGWHPLNARLRAGGNAARLAALLISVMSMTLVVLILGMGLHRLLLVHMVGTLAMTR